MQSVDRKDSDSEKMDGMVRQKLSQMLIFMINVIEYFKLDLEQQPNALEDRNDR